VIVSSDVPTLAESVLSLVGYLSRVTTQFYLHAPLATRYPPPGEGSKPLIVMLHGYAGTVGEFDYLYHHLRRTVGEVFDFGLVDLLDPEMRDAPEAHLWRLDAYLEAYRLTTRDLYFLCYSLSGLIARCYTHRGNAAARVRALTMIATPNGGINWWNLLPIHWMRSAGFHTRFNAVYPALSTIRYQLLAGTKGANLVEGLPNDGVVGRWSVETLLDCADQDAAIVTCCYPLDHWALLRDPRVAADIAAFFQRVWAGQPG